jgi:hypothetical protein
MHLPRSSKARMSLFYSIADTRPSLPVKVNGGLYVKSTGAPPSSPTSRPSNEEKATGTVRLRRPSPVFLSPV